MDISTIKPVNSSFLNVNKSNNSTNPSSFESMLNQYIQEANGAVKNSEAQAISLAKGEAVNLHDVTIAAQKASIAVTLTTQVRDKAVEAYQEMMRMQI